ncbi:hypothetical protein BDV96DRAFT_587438 [Lophiotrema nucula]|uniref:Uncharacterized protein n=1 Tax=Lophiotrema nucula TaxID=690887 RepID=A0A6A5YR85_9PLEO|nr:hypothetical protein BDV96DRAFT_587438 [Lophiotrema nucula]
MQTQRLSMSEDDTEMALDCLNRLLKERQVLRDKRANLQTGKSLSQRTRAQRNRVSLELIVLEGALSDACTAYAKASCRKLSSQLLRLPRELRDPIYAHLWKKPQGERTELSDLVEILSPRDMQGWKSDCSGPPCSCTDHLPHYADVNFMGRQVVFEVLESCNQYENESRDSCYVRATELEQFMYADAFHVGVTRTDLFRGMGLTIEFGNLVYGDEESYASEKRMVEEKLHAVVNLLMEFQDQYDRNIIFDIEHEHDTPVNLSQMLEIIRPAFLHLRDAGANMWLDYANPSSKIEWDFDESTFGWDVEEWEDERIDLGMRELRLLDHPDDRLDYYGLPEHTTEEEFFAVQGELQTRRELAWTAIMQDLYSVHETDSSDADPST